MTQTSMFKFRVGDRVRGSFGTKTDGVVTEVREGTVFPYCVRWNDDEDSYHAGHELVRRYAPKFKVGDRVITRSGNIRFIVGTETVDGAFLYKARDPETGGWMYYGAPELEHATAPDAPTRMAMPDWMRPVADEMVDEARAENAWVEQRSGTCKPSQFDHTANELRRDGWRMVAAQYVRRLETPIIFYVFEREVEGCACCGGRVDAEGYCNQCDLPF